jgi:2,3-diketo-5-methylthio-1-phosphopentane phosphatase
MKEFIFISDYDNTITKKDFYWILLDDYIGEKGKAFYKEWKKDKLIGTEFLNQVFTWHKFSKEEHDEALSKVEMDRDLEKVVNWVDENEGEFYILSAGFRYYIDHVLKAQGLEHLKVLTNEGSFENGIFKMEPDQSSPWYSEVYGIDKGLVAQYYKKQCKTLYFVGDSEPDFHAAKHADIVFAKEELARIMEVEGMEYIPYTCFLDIYQWLIQSDI